MKNLIASVFVGLLSGITVYLLIDNLFERPNKTVNPDEVEDFGEEDQSLNHTIDIKTAETSTS